MKLVYDGTGVEVAKGDHVATFRGEPVTITGWLAPHKPASTGRIFLETETESARAFFPGVVGCSWVEREDRE